MEGAGGCDPELFAFVLFEFESTVPEELPLKVGRLVKILKDIDSFWYLGKDLQNGCTGQFPKDFVQLIELPTFSKGECLLFALDTFYPEEKDDLSFQKGNVIVLESKVDGAWGRGRCNNKRGIFPLNYTQRMVTTRSHVALPDDFNANAVICTVEAIMPLSAQIENELSFAVGDVITVTEIMEDDWARGQLGNASGVFPLSFTTYFADRSKPSRNRSPVLDQFQPLSEKNRQKKFISVNDASNQSSSEQTLKTNYPTNSYSSMQSYIQPNSNIRPLAQQVTSNDNEAQGIRDEADVSKTNSYKGINGDHSFINKQVDNSNAKINDVVVAKFTYHRRNSNELSFIVGDLIDIVDRKSDMWLYGKLRGSYGYIPRTYVSEGSSARQSNDRESTASTQFLTNARNTHEEEVEEIIDVSAEKKERARLCLSNVLRKHFDVRLVVNDFDAITDFDLTVHVGETVNVVEQINAEWCEAKNTSGKVGFVPNSCLQQVTSGASRNSVPEDSPQLSKVGSLQKPSDSEKYRAADQNETRLKLHKQQDMQANNATSALRTNQGELHPQKIGANFTHLPSTSEKPNSKQTSIHKDNENKIPALRSSANHQTCNGRLAVDTQLNRRHSCVQAKPALSPKPFHRSESAHEKLFCLEKKNSDPNLTQLNKDEPLPNKDIKRQRRHTQKITKSDSAAFFQVKYKKNKESDSISTSSFDSTQSSSISSGSNGRISMNDASNNASDDITLAFDPLRTREDPPPDVPRRTTSNRRASRVAPPPPLHNPSSDLAMINNVSTTKNRQKLAPNRPPQPTIKLNNGTRTQTQVPVAKFKSAEHKLKIEKVRSEIEEYCRMQKELETLYNSSFDGKERQSISENKKFVVAKLRRLQTELNNIIIDVDHIYESLEEKEPPLDFTIQRSSSPTPPVPPPVERVVDIKAKRETKRYHVIRELVTTEEDYLNDIVITIDDIMKPLLERELPLEVKIEVLFGNIEDICDFSTELLQSLKKVYQVFSSPTQASDRDYDIGRVFINHIPRMKEVYKMYCRNHDDATALLEKYEEDPDFQVPVQECLNSVKNKVNTFDLGSFLIKPVQRILKYPLLLQELLKLTDVPQPGETTVCYNNLLHAVKMMQEVANAINEDKRQKDLVRKYRKGSQEVKLSGKISRLSLHSVKKKTARISLRIGHATGLNQPETIDEHFNAIEQKFKDIEKAVKAFMQNADSFVDRYRDVLNVEHLLTEHITDLSASDHTKFIVEYGIAMRRVAEHLYRQFHDQSQLRVHSPLSSMLVRFSGPQAIIDKRFDKLLDYENCQKNSDSKEKTQMARNVYEALNQQLLDELPKLCDLTYKLLQTCIGIFVRLQIRFQQNMLKTITPVLEMIVVNVKMDDLQTTAIKESFSATYNQVLVDMQHYNVVPTGLSAMSSPTQPRPVKRASIAAVEARQTQTQQQDLLSKHKVEDLYVATTSYSSPDKVDISCITNDIIVVIKKQDPLGNTNKWFCDNGASKGFLPSNILRTYNPAAHPRSTLGNTLDNCRITGDQTPSPLPRLRDKSPTPSSRSSGSVDSIRITPSNTMRSPLSPSPYSMRQGLYGSIGADATDGSLEDQALHDVFTEEEEMLDDAEYGEIGETSPGNPKEHFRVEFPFTARTTLELSVKEGEIVNMIVPHDLEGNTEWWLMANSDGKQGYVPFNYMTRAQYL